MLKNREFETPLTRAMLTLLRPGDSFVDVGSNEGYFSQTHLRGTLGGVFDCDRVGALLPRCHS
jgi:hypothetical protein